MSRQQFMLHRWKGKVGVVAPHAHQLVVMVHLHSRIGNNNIPTSQKERTYFLPFGTHHFHAPGFLGQIGYRDQIPFLYKIHGMGI